MQSPPISQAEIDARISGHVDELLELWWAEQGTSKPRDLELIACTRELGAVLVEGERTSRLRPYDAARVTQ